MAAACAREANCVPTVNELVKRAAAACSKDPSCVCDWGKHPKQCFLSEVQRHKQLKKDSTQIEAELNKRGIGAEERKGLSGVAEMPSDKTVGDKG
jgi:hypothetical protein